ncbi:MAG: hypothetical protein ACPGC9_01190 [Cytophagales bacterium]
MKLKNVKLGSLFELRTAKGRVYLHYIAQVKPSNFSTILRVLPGFYPERPAPTELQAIAKLPEQFFTQFTPLPGCVLFHEAIFEEVGWHPIDRFSPPTHMRGYEVGGAGYEDYFVGWSIVDIEVLKPKIVQTLTPAQKKLSPHKLSNPETLRKDLEAGFSLESWDPIKAHNLKVGKNIPTVFDDAKALLARARSGVHNATPKD